MEPVSALGVLTNIFSNIFVQIVLTIIAVLVAQAIAKALMGRIIRHAVRSNKYQTKTDEKKREKTLTTIFRTAISVTFWVIGIIIILVQLNVNIAALLTGAGLIGIIVGFGAQSAIKDFLAGIFIILENQYRVGDVVTLNAGKEITGVVDELTIRITRLRDLDGNMHIIQNGSAGVVTNWTFEYANVNLTIGVAYDSDIDKVEKVINQVGQEIQQDEELGEHVIEPVKFFRVDDFADSAIKIKVLGKVKPAKQWQIAGEFRRRIKKAFDKNGIVIPFPQVVIHK